MPPDPLALTCPPHFLTCSYPSEICGIVDYSINTDTCKELSLSKEYNIVVSHDELMHVWDKIHATNNICYCNKIQCPWFDSMTVVDATETTMKVTNKIIVFTTVKNRKLKAH